MPLQKYENVLNLPNLIERFFLFSQKNDLEMAWTVKALVSDDEKESPNRHAIRRENNKGKMSFSTLLAVDGLKSETCIFGFQRFYHDIHDCVDCLHLIYQFHLDQ